MLHTSPELASGPPQGVSPVHHLQKQQDEVAVLRQALAWLVELGIEVPRDAAPDGHLFSNCWLLGRVVDVLKAARSGQVPARRQPPPAGRRPFNHVINDHSRWQQLCEEMGVSRGQLPLLADVEAGRAAAAICSCLCAVADRCRALGISVPEFCSVGARSSLRHSVSRKNSVKWAEMFVSTGDSPPKKPALGPLLTPRAYQGKASSPANALRDSNSSLRDWLQSSLQKEEAQQHQQLEGGQDKQQQQQVFSGLGHTVAAMEAAAAKAAAAAIRQRSPGADQAPQQWRRPVLPHLDLQAALKVAAAEAAEQAEYEEGEEALAAGASSGVSPLCSPLSSTSSMASPEAGYSSGSSYISSTSSPVPQGTPSRYRMSSSRLQERAHPNPLWSSSPTPSLPAAGTASEAGHTPTPPASAPPVVTSSRLPTVYGGEQPGRYAARSDEDDLLEGDTSYGGGDLLHTLLSPPRLKPAHTQLLGALMHTAGGGTSVAARGASQQQEVNGEDAVSHGVLAVEGQQQQGQAAEDEEEEEEYHSPARHARLTASVAPPGGGSPIPYPKVNARASAYAQADDACSGGNTGGKRGGGRKMALALLGVVAGAAAAVVAGAMQQQRGGQRKLRGLSNAARPQPVLPQSGGRPLPSEQQRRFHGGGSQDGPVCWDSPHAITRG